MLAAAAAGLIPTVLVAPAAAADGGRSVEMQDKCERKSFNAALQDEVCVGDGNVTFQKFSEKLNPKDGGHHAWRNDRRETTIHSGEHVHVTNTGGEVHSFTEVANFGAGIVPPLNAALPKKEQANPARFDGDPGPTFVPPGGSLTLEDLSPGTHLFECLIHPWMRTTVEVRR
ncbi:cupredoxin domain-containing protein [Pseudonocardia acidicola]|uniref:Uncharacterized protein n=1 Tax=Pseudonocardia acidicola TaxID=2724939 RepID=A0ABX1SHZ0_9PSEU|nr:hypothetical protein [Pseudonocardia acidicola]NMI01184.1 hypothetical protein [Pseudonocardia acidicola]